MRIVKNRAGPCRRTELDFMPKGWRSKFGIEMCEEIREALLSSGKTYAEGLSVLNRYRIFWIKRENLRMQWEDTGEVKEIIENYQDLSEHICCHCGKPATRNNHRSSSKRSSSGTRAMRLLVP